MWECDSAPSPFSISVGIAIATFLDKSNQNIFIKSLFLFIFIFIFCSFVHSFIYSSIHLDLLEGGGTYELTNLNILQRICSLVVKFKSLSTLLILLV